MTPAIRFLKTQKIKFSLHQYQLDAASDNYGQDAANALGVEHDRVFKTLLVSLNGEARNLAVCIVPVAGQLSLKAAAKAHGAKKAQMADPQIAEKTTGYVLGGISPFGQKRALKTAVDDSALGFDTIFTSGGKRGLEIEFAPGDLLRSLRAKSAPLTA